MTITCSTYEIDLPDDVNVRRGFLRFDKDDELLRKILSLVNYVFLRVFFWRHFLGAQMYSGKLGGFSLQIDTERTSKSSSELKNFLDSMTRGPGVKIDEINFQDTRVEGHCNCYSADNYTAEIYWVSDSKFLLDINFQGEGEIDSATRAAIDSIIGSIRLKS